MKYLVRGWLVLVLLAGLPALAHALDLGGASTDVFNAMSAVVKLLVGLTVLIGLIYLLVKKK
jgi:di/tricarboxylate transporter